MYTKDLEELIDGVLADGVITEQERNILRKRAQACGEDPDEVMVVVEGRLTKMKKSNNPSKNGNIVKCPSCGAPVKAGALRCEECGYEFRNVNANHTTEKFNEGLQKLQGGNIFTEVMLETKRVSFIENYPIPNSLEDVLELMQLSKQNADRHGDTEQQAYWKLFCRCIDKVKNSGMAGDPRFMPLLDFYQKQSKKKDVSGWITGIIAFLFFVGLGGGLVYLFYDTSQTKKQIETSITTQLDSLTAVIDGMPTPTKENYTECAYRVTKLVWSPINCQFNDGEGGKDSKALAEKQQNAIKSFVHKKNVYIHILNSLHVADPIPDDSFENYTSSVPNTSSDEEVKTEEKTENEVQTLVDKQYNKLASTIENMPQASAGNVKSQRDQLRQLIWQPITTEAETAKKTFTSPTDDEKYERTKKEAYYKLVKVKASLLNSIYEETFNEEDVALKQLADKGYEE